MLEVGWWGWEVIKESCQILLKIEGGLKIKLFVGEGM